MRVDRTKHIQNEIEKVTTLLQDAMLTGSIQDRKVLKFDFTGSDILLRMEGGKSWIFSAVLNDKGRPVIEFAYSGGTKETPEDYSI